MNQHTPCNWWRLLSVVAISAQLLVTTSTPVENEVKAVTSESLSPRGRVNPVRSFNADHASHTSGESMIEHASGIFQESSDSLAKEGNSKSDKAQFELDLTGIKKSYGHNPTEKNEPRNSDHNHSKMLLATIEDIASFKKSSEIFQDIEISNIEYLEATGGADVKDLLYKLTYYNQEILDLLVKKLDTMVEEVKLPISIKESSETSYRAHEQSIKDEFLKVSQKEKPVPGLLFKNINSADETTQREVPTNTNQRPELEKIVSTSSYSKGIQGSMDPQEIMQGLKYWLQKVEFPRPYLSSIGRSIEKRDEEPVVKTVFQAIEYMHKYELITPAQMFEFFNGQNIENLGRHIVAVQLFDIEKDYYQFAPDIEFFIDDWRTHHLQRCLTDLPEHRKRDVVHAAIRMFWESFLSVHSQYKFPTSEIKILFTEDPDTSQIIWEDSLQQLAEIFEHNRKFKQQNAFLEWKSKFHFYLMDFILRYNPLKEHIISKVAVKEDFLLNFVKTKLDYRKTQLLDMGTLCFHKKWNHGSNGIQNEAFTENQLEEKIENLRNHYHELEKLHLYPTNAQIDEIRNYIWIPKLPDLKTE